MSDLVGNPEDRFSRVAAHLFMLLTIAALVSLTHKLNNYSDSREAIRKWLDIVLRKQSGHKKCV